MNVQELFDRIDRSVKEQIPFVAYRKPDCKEISSYFQKTGSVTYLEDYTRQGFVFAPFDSRKKTVIFLAKDCFRDKTLYKKSDIDLSSEKPIENPETLTGKQEHIGLVKKGIDFIKSGSVSKVVLSRKEEIPLKNKKISSLFKKLLDSYTSAFVYVWYHPEVGLWLGATPETLLTVKDNRFATMALAGTQIFKGSANVLWAPKERQEQQFVTDYILAKLKKYTLETGKTYTLRAGSLLHICKEITGIIDQKNGLKDVISALHPTPAVCGLPDKPARDFILQNEGYDREFYTGYLGELNLKNTTALYVNLRCMQIKMNLSMAAMYIGGGITTDSDPVKEWKETVAKSNIIKLALF